MTRNGVGKYDIDDNTIYVFAKNDHDNCHKSAIGI